MRYKSFNDALRALYRTPNRSAYYIAIAPDTPVGEFVRYMVVAR